MVDLDTFKILPRLSSRNALEGRRSQMILCSLMHLVSGHDVRQPIFLVGCGRSGTTILGHIISQHRHFLYLNEARFVWLRGYPQTDIWTAKAAERQGRLDLDAAICTAHGNRSVRTMFGLALSLYRKSRLVEKLPEHSFRLPFLMTIFPDARFIHLIRNGLHVARSIERQAVQSKWYGYNHYKWFELRRIALTFPWGEEILQYCRDPFRMGLLEWRLSLEFGFRYLRDLSRDRYLEVRYETLVEDPLQITDQLQSFLGEGTDQTMEQFALRHVRQKISGVGPTVPSEQDFKITGQWLRDLRFL